MEIIQLIGGNAGEIVDMPYAVAKRHIEMGYGALPSAITAIAQTSKPAAVLPAAATPPTSAPLPQPYTAVGEPLPRRGRGRPRKLDQVA
jgi:hypothetical protein